MANKTKVTTKATAAELLATSGAAMRQLREKGVVLTFPSGANYRVRMPGAAGMLKRGNLPNPLLSFVVDAFYKGASQAKYDAFWGPKEQQEDALALMESLKVVCQEMFLEPLVVDDPQADNEVSIDDVPLADQEWAFRLLFAPVEEVRRFRAEPKANVASMAQAENVSTEAQQ